MIIEFEIKEKMFPCARFNIGFPLNKLNTIMTVEKRIIIKKVNCCYKKNPNYYLIEGEKMTYAYVIRELIKQGFECNCSHSFLDEFKQNTDIQYTACLGS